MALLGLKRVAKDKLVKYLLKLLQEQEVKNWVDNHIRTPASLPTDLFASSLPYQEIGITPEKTNTPINNTPIIITSRFRSGSTLLWNLFRNIESCTAYYEPFNERQWFNPEMRGSFVDSTHRGVSDYWKEFEGLDSLAEFYDESWGNSRLLMTESCWDQNMWEFINMMISSAPNRAVMQFNRIDFRLPWLKSHFSHAKFIHLYRNPRDQWCSFLTDPKVMTAETIQDTYIDNFYLNSWCDDLQTHFPFLSREVTAHPYQRFYLLWVLSYLFGKYYSDVTIEFESLTENPKEEITRLLTAVNLPVEHANNLTTVISPPKKSRWKSYADHDWFNQHERACHEVLQRWGIKITMEQIQ